MLKNPHHRCLRDEVSLDMALLSESQRAVEGDEVRCDGVKYVAFLSSLFATPVYGVLDTDDVFRVFITQRFREENEHNLKSLLISLMEFTSEVLGADLRFMLYLKRSCFEVESGLLMRNLNWLGGSLVLDDLLNRYNDWFIMEFEV